MNAVFLAIYHARSINGDCWIIVCDFSFVRVDSSIAIRAVYVFLFAARSLHMYAMILRVYLCSFTIRIGFLSLALSLHTHKYFTAYAPLRVDVDASVWAFHSVAFCSTVREYSYVCLYKCLRYEIAITSAKYKTINYFELHFNRQKKQSIWKKLSDQWIWLTDLKFIILSLLFNKMYFN